MELLSLEEMQKINLDMLLEFDEICKSNDLRYDLVGGSLLGAVRHKGFIPWDDDIDVNMPRPDYEKFLKLSLEGDLQIPKHREIISERNKTFARHYARYIRHDVKRISEYSQDDDCPYIGIDIFVEDGTYSNKLLFAIQTFRINFWRRALLLSLSRPNISSKGKKVAVLKDIIRPIFKCIGSYKIAKHLDRICSKVKFEKAKYVAAINGMYGKKERWLKEDMLPQTNLDFEGYKFPGYKNYDIYLSNLYGDYMKIPSENERKPHGDKGYRVSVDD